jgi:hypothetical protein
MKTVLIAICAAGLFGGCATNKAEPTKEAAKREHDAKIVRGLLDSMASPPHSFPANLPR